MWKAPRIRRKVRADYALSCCGNVQAVEGRPGTRPATATSVGSHRPRVGGGEMHARAAASKTVDSYEVVMAGGGEGARAARVSVLEGSPKRLDEGTRYAQEEILPQARQLSGFKGVVSLIDREHGRTKLITLWESDEALRASEEQANQLRQRAAEGAAGRIVGIERYEVALAELGQLVVR